MQADTHLSESGAHTPVLSYPSRLRETLWVLFASIYPQHDSGTLWSERDSYLTCRGNSLQDGQNKPLDLPRNLREAVIEDNATAV